MPFPNPQPPTPNPHLLITAGPTREPIDAVRFISNRSSGRMGIALAEAAVEAGHRVTLLLGPVLAPASLGERVEVHRFNTTSELEALLSDHFPGADTLVMAAAVADYRVASALAGKAERKKQMQIQLEGTPDLVAGVAQRKRDDQRIVAFALEEPHQLEDRARAKMKRKGVDAIVANPLVTMEDERIAAVLLWADGGRDEPGPMPKPAFARWLIKRLNAR
jgi:phosphopantothenoylcysteine decarboxylase/phosphopantothenate--cysteine ligase